MGTVSTTTGYDIFGRATSYTDADGNTSSTTYDINGKVVTSSDGKGTTTYTYDGTDYWGRQEHRGLLTKIDTPGVGAFQGVYGEDGQLIQQAYPNWLVAEYRYDNAGNNISLTYTKNQNRWLAFTNTLNASGGAAQATSSASRQDYTYDTAGRLTKVADTYSSKCTTRTYSFTPNTNRSSLSTYGPATDSNCSTTGTPTTQTYSYDQADRLTNPGYVYDTFGRTTTLPATGASGGADVSLSYHVNDMVASISASGVSRTFTLDPEGRVRFTVQTGGAVSGTMVNHYGSNSDEPIWISEANGSWSRNLESLGGGLGAIQLSTGQVTLQLTNLHGDIVATADASVLTAGVDAYFEQTEYGINRAENTINPRRYGWLGSHQRSVDALGGLILMGIRLYNPTAGRFLQVDPIDGGSANKYDYCISDPVNCLDLDGRWALALAVFAIPGVGQVAAALAAAALLAAAAYLAYKTVKQAVAYAKSRPKHSSNKSNSSKWFPSRKAAENAAKKDAKNGKNSCYRGPCKSNDHAHVDTKNSKGEIKHTKHYRWHSATGKKRRR